MTANRLNQSTSPYLLQHKDNPVAWQPWDEAALADAKNRDQPILLSIGYASCHWCHVMAHECFEDPAIAAHMNEGYICIKVDREERPDLDAIYQPAAQALTGQGGWPLTVFLTPEGEPFFGGTYFPPADRHGLPGFPRLLAGIRQAWEQEQEVVRHNTQELMHAIQKQLPPPNESQPVLDHTKAIQFWMRQADHTHYGLGQSPKFPQAPVLEMLLDLAWLKKDADTTTFVLNILKAMACGGIHDHVAGGFHRYSVDPFWLVPHFEKMLYDNGQLLSMYAKAYSIEPHPLFQHTIERCIHYLQREMMRPDGLLYAAQDADAGGKEGAFHTWTPDELANTLSPDEVTLFSKHFQVTSAGNFEGRNIPHIHFKTGNTTLKDAPELMNQLTDIEEKLYAVREQRTRPGLDDKILTDWNAMTFTGLIEAGIRLNRPEWLALAKHGLHTLWDKQIDADGQVRHCMIGEVANHERFLEDAANVSWTWLTLYLATGEETALQKAVLVADRMFEDFATDKCYLSMTPESATDLIYRPVQATDSATPSGNGLAARVAVVLFSCTSDIKWQTRAEQLFQAFGHALDHHPGTMPTLTLALAETQLGFPHASCPDAIKDKIQQGFTPFVRLLPSEEKSTLQWCAEGHCRELAPSLEALHEQIGLILS